MLQNTQDKVTGEQNKVRPPQFWETLNWLSESSYLKLPAFLKSPDAN